MSNTLLSKMVPTFSQTVLSYLTDVTTGRLAIDQSQLEEFPPDLARRLKVAPGNDSSPISGAAAKTLGKRHVALPEKVDMKTLLDYMSSEALNAERPLSDAERDLTYPISNYFINSSHNTYLTGNQLYGSASTDSYTDALYRGCRCIEIDVWDGKSVAADPSRGGDEAGGVQRAEPRVLHGHTFTKEVSFRAVCEAIRTSAFKRSDLPVIVSLEIHAGLEQQELMVQIMQNTWDGMLVLAPAEECQVLPSPGSLRYKILVKVKGAPVAKIPDELHPVKSNASVEKSESDSDQAESQPPLVTTSPSRVLLKRDHEETAKEKSDIITSLSALGIYTRAFHFKDLTGDEAAIPTHVFSLSEKKVMAVHQSHGPSLFSHNRNFLMRAFPLGSRVTSSNLDPTLFWRKGIQMVALNWQTIDASMMLNHGMFADSNGWVLKPEGYRGTLSSKDSASAPLVTAESQAEAIKHYSLDLRIEVIALQDLDTSKHPYVKCELHIETPEEREGRRIEGDGKVREGAYKRHTKDSNSKFDFKKEPLEFLGIYGVVPALSFVRFKVMVRHLGPDELLAWSCIRLDRLKEGLRFIHLMHPNGLETSAVLLVKSSKRLA